MKLFKKLLPIALLSVAGLAQAKVPQFTELGFGTGTLDAAGYNAYWYQNFSIKINDRSSFTPELLTAFQITKDKASDFQVQHKYLRIVITDKNLAKMGDWNLALAYRYVVPTTKGAQAAGSFGRIGFRPAFSTKVGAFSLLIRNEFQIHAQRNQYQVNPAGTANPKGNALVGNALEIIPSYDLGSGMDTSLYFANSNTMVGKDKGATKNTYSNQMDFQAEFGYTIAAAGDLRVGLTFSTSTAYFGLNAQGEKNTFDLFKKDASEFSVSLQKAY
jgi:hypothetical protein